MDITPPNRRRLQRICEYPTGGNVITCAVLRAVALVCCMWMKCGSWPAPPLFMDAHRHAGVCSLYRVTPRGLITPWPRTSRPCLASGARTVLSK
eukprot:172097-Alexandrium_andersonii.AAC.1